MAFYCNETGRPGHDALHAGLESRGLGQRSFGDPAGVASCRVSLEGLYLRPNLRPILSPPLSLGIMSLPLVFLSPNRSCPLVMLEFGELGSILKGPSRTLFFADQDIWNVHTARGKPAHMRSVVQLVAEPFLRLNICWRKLAWNRPHRKLR
jgi:hypothetical protein